MDYEYILSEKDRYFVPRLSSICESIARNTAFKTEFNIEPLIVNPRVWAWLKNKHAIKLLQL